MDEVLAKSAPPLSLRQHTNDCLSVFRSVRKLFPYLPQTCGVPRFYEHLFYAIYLHDLGKTARGFQAMLRPGGKPWGYRHEMLSAGFVRLLASLDEDEQRAVAMAIITHHKGVAELRDRFSTTTETGAETLQARLSELSDNFDYIQDFLRDLPQYAEEYLGYTLPQPLVPRTLAEVDDAYKFGVRWYAARQKDIAIGDEELTQLHSTYGTFLRGLMIACDHLASGGREEVRAGLQREEIKNAVFAAVKEKKQQRPLTEEGGSVIAQSGTAAENELYSYQRRMMKQTGSAFLSAPTGAGKTEASLLWASANRNVEDGGRIFYVLPYTASINAMHKRLAKLFGGENVGVLHGKASYFVYQTMLDREYTPQEAARFARETQGLTKKLYRPLKILTPFQILKAFFGVRGWESQITELTGGLFIFDEIHVYDAHTTALILKIIERLAKLDAKFLFLSATFPAFLKRKIESIIPEIQHVSLDERDADDARLVNKPRHRIELLTGEISSHTDKIVADLRQGKRPLVVCNTVKRAQAVYEELRVKAKTAAMLHGRFILLDRERIERRLGDVQLLVGTQAVEVSLDLDFDVLYTEPAAIDALVQRFGRVNRSGSKCVVPVRICTLGSEADRYFYDIERIERTLAALKDGEELNQVRVTELVEGIYATGYNPNEQTIFNEVTASFGNVISNLYPFDDSEDKDLFYNLIKSIEVVPGRANEDAYLAARDAKQHFDAVRYFCNLSLGQRAMLGKMERISFRTDNRGGHYWFVDSRYDPELGLLLSERETDAGFID
jgi:CRISPR-associated endonuclease/helicase Cas3